MSTNSNSFFDTNLNSPIRCSKTCKKQLISVKSTRVHSTPKNILLNSGKLIKINTPFTIKRLFYKFIPTIIQYQVIHRHIFENSPKENEDFFASLNKEIEELLGKNDICSKTIDKLKNYILLKNLEKMNSVKPSPELLSLIAELKKELFLKLKFKFFINNFILKGTFLMKLTTIMVIFIKKKTIRNY